MSVAGVGQLVERGLQREVAHGLAGGAQPAGVGNVEPDLPAMGGDVGAGVGQGRDRSDGLHRGILGADRRGGIVINRRQCEVPGGAEPQALHGLRPVAGWR